MARDGEIEGEWLMGWPERRRPAPLQRKDEHGRVVYQRSPWAELQGLLTPTDLRYIVAQLGMPEALHPDDWSLSVEGMVARPLRLNLAELQRLPGRTVRVVHECSGTDADFFYYLRDGGERPSQFDLEQPHTGQTSSGEFTGIPLAVVLEEAGLQHHGAVSVLAQGFDRGTPGEWATEGASAVPEQINFEKALPIEKALDPDTIVAWGLNGEYLRHVHGAPLRLIVPGWSGNWSVKWLQRLAVLDHMPPVYYQTEYFFYADGVDDERREMITSMGVRCVVIEPRHGDSLSAGRNVIRGLAWSGCGAIERVEVSVDGGESWREAHVEEPRERWLWVRWSLPWDAPQAGRFTVMARAVDEQGRVQPQTPWNFLRKNFDGIIPVEVTVG